MATSESKRQGPRFEKLAPPQIGKPPRSATQAPTGTTVSRAPSAAAPATAQPAIAVTADVIGTASAKPLQNAVAITYQSSAGAPKIVAKGRGLIAEQIIARAREHGVFVHESKELVALLMQVELDDHIPPALYRVVAELLAWLYRIEAARQSGGKVS